MSLTLRFMSLFVFQLLSHFTDFTGYVVFIITSFLAGVESADQCLLNSKVLSCFSGVIMSIRSFFLLYRFYGRWIEASRLICPICNLNHTKQKMHALIVTDGGGGGDNVFMCSPSNW